MNPRFLLVLGSALAAISAASARADQVSLEDQIQEFHLDNGLTLLIVENHDSPTIGAVTAFSVGTAEESPGSIGVTHILEHMLFKGTTEIGTTDWEGERPHHDRIEELTQEMLRLRAERKPDQARIDELLEERDRERALSKEYAVDNELSGLYEEAGGANLNAFTGTDMTAYVQATPSNRLEMWMYLESERLRRPILRQFYTEVENVQEERRLVVEGDAYGKLRESFHAVAFDEHGYGLSGIGYPSDIANITRTEAEDWFRVYYAPNRMTLALVGDVDAEEALQLTRDYFGDIPAQDPPTPLQTFDIEKSGMRRVEVEFDAEPRLLMGWPKQNIPHPDDAALHVIAEVLTGGESSRLVKALVKELQIASMVDVDHEVPGNRWDNLIAIHALPRSPHTTDDLENAIWLELERLKREGVTDRELAKAKNRIRTARLRSLSDNLQFAIELGIASATHGDWRILQEAGAAVEAVTAKDVQSVARQTFRRNRSVIATLVEPAFEPDPDKELAGSEIVARMVDALGGADELGSVTSLQVSTDVSIQTPGGALEASAQSVYDIAGRRARQDFSIFGQLQVQVTAPGGAWSAQGGNVADMAPDERADSQADLERDLFLMAYPALATDFVLQADEGDGGAVVTVYGASGSSFRVTLNAESGLPATVTYDGTHPMTGAPAAFEQTFDDFRNVAGVQRPHLIVTRINGEIFAEAKATEVLVNPDIAADTFSRPQS